MFTKCPTATCGATYRVTSEALRAAMGMVRCVKCNAVFNAASTVQDVRPAGAVIPLGHQLPFVRVMGDRMLIPPDVLQNLAAFHALKRGKSESEAEIPPELLSSGRFSREALADALPRGERPADVPLDEAPAPPSGRRVTRPAASDFLLAARNVIRHRRRSAMGLSAIGLGVVAMLLAGGFIEWSKWFLRENTIQAHLGHIQVVKKDFLKLGESDPFAFLLPDRDALAKAIAATPGVVALAPRLSFSGLISFGDVSISFLGEGVDPEQERKVSTRLTITEGAGLSPKIKNGIIVGKGLAKNLNVKPGQQVVLLANSANGGTNGVDATILGLFQTSSKAYDDASLRVPITLAHDLLRVAGAHRWVLLLDDTKKTVPVLEDLRQRFRGEGEIEFVPWFDLADFYNKTAKLFSAQINVVWLVIALIIVVSISNTFLMNVIERTGEIGTLLALGFRQQKILFMFVSEGIVLGCLGGAGGALVGWTLAEIISAIGIPMPPAPGMDFPVDGKIMVTGPVALVGLCLGMGATVMASVYPARKAARLNIIDALRHAR